MKKIFAILGLAAISGGLVVGAASKGNQVKKADAFIETDVEWDYLAFDGNNFKLSDSGDPNGWVTGRSATFWGFRSFNALDNFYDGFHNEGWQGTITSASWKQTKRYVTFTLGGNPDNTITIRKKSDNSVVATIQNTYWEDPKIPENMILRVVDLNSYIGQSLCLEIDDHATSGFNATTFGCLKVSQSQEDVARSISVYKYNLSKRTRAGDNANNCDNVARTAILDIMADSEEWTAFDGVVLDNADMDFEDSDQCTNLALDTTSVTGFDGQDAGYDTISWGYGAAYNLANQWDGFVEKMPFNKQGDAFFRGEYGGDGAKYTLLTNDFKLSGKGYISIKLAGNGTKVEVIKVSDGSVLASTTNLGWADNNLSASVFKRGTRLNTMTRHIIDVRAHLGETVRIAISDDSTAYWSILMFDELKTNYADVPVFKLDYDHQTYSAGTFYGTIPSILIHDSTYEGPLKNDGVKEAYDYLEEWRGTIRNKEHGTSVCGDYLTSNDTKALINKYKNNLSAAAKAIVDDSDDFEHVGANPKPGEGDWNENWDTIEPVITNMGHNIRYIANANSIALGSSSIHSVSNNSDDVVVYSIIIATMALCVIGGYFLFRKRKQEQ